MAKGAEKNKTNQMVNTAQNQSQNYTTGYLNTTDPERAQARSQGNDMYGQLYGGYTDLANNKGITPELRDALGFGAGGHGVGGGGVPVPNMSTGMYGDVNSAYRNFMGGGGVDISRTREAMANLSGLGKTGGWSPTDRASQEKLIGGLTDIGQTGGVDAAGQARMRGNGVYDEFAKTGGYTPEQTQDFRARATSVIPSIYANAKASADQMGRVTGQYNPAAMAKMSRQAGYDSQKAATDAEVQLQDSIRSNRLAGAGGAASTEATLQNLMSSNKLAGLTGAGTMRGNMLHDISGTQIGASTGMGNLDIGSQDLVQRGKMFGTSGLEGLADKEAAAQRANAASGNAAASQNAANAKWLAEFGVSNQEAGLGGLGNLYTSSPAEVAYYDNQRQNSVNSNVNNTGNMAGIRMANNPSMMSQIGGLVSGGLGAAGGIMSGMGAMGYGKQRQPGQGQT